MGKQLPLSSPADIFDGVREVAEDLVLFGVDPFAFGVDPAATLAALHHPRLVIVVVVAASAERAEAALFLLQAAGGAEGLLLQEVRDFQFSAGFALETLAALLQ